MDVIFQSLSLRQVVFCWWFILVTSFELNHPKNEFLLGPPWLNPGTRSVVAKPNNPIHMGWQNFPDYWTGNAKPWMWFVSTFYSFGVVSGWIFLCKILLGATHSFRQLYVVTVTPWDFATVQNIIFMEMNITAIKNGFL